jgi:hypothetical protein
MRKEVNYASPNMENTVKTEECSQVGAFLRVGRRIHFFYCRLILYPSQRYQPTLKLLSHLAAVASRCDCAHLVGCQAVTCYRTRQPRVDSAKHCPRVRESAIRAPDLHRLCTFYTYSGRSSFWTPATTFWTISWIREQCIRSTRQLQRLQCAPRNPMRSCRR